MRNWLVVADVLLERGVEDPNEWQAATAAADDDDDDLAQRTADGLLGLEMLDDEEDVRSVSRRLNWMMRPESLQEIEVHRRNHLMRS